MITELAESFKKPFSLFTPYAPAANREPWQALDPDLKVQLIHNGEACLHFSYPSLLATDFMDFSRTGNREPYQEKLFKRRNVLDCLVLAECIEYQGRFMDDIINGLSIICEENAWQLPAHNSYVRDTPQFLLPDVTRPVIDLFAAETGAVLALAEYLLRDKLEEISPTLSKMIHLKLETALFQPYLNEHFWWMGDGVTHMNNWTAWCTQNILLAAFTRPLSEEIQTRIFLKACKSTDYFLDEYEEDGCCDEGAQYYHHAGLCLFNILEVLNGITKAAFLQAFESTKIKNMAAYILHAHIDDCYYVNFADCSPVAGRCNAREFLFGKRTNQPSLMAFAASDYQNSEDPFTIEEHNLFYRLQTIFTHEEMKAYKKHATLSHPDIYYPSTGLFAARDQHLYLAVKGGDNGDSHNHNDTGSFTIYKDGKPMLIDIGVETYTKKTFSPHRYEIWTMQSRYHNLPSFFDGHNEIMQQDGAAYGAAAVVPQLGEKICSISMDIAGAYPSDLIRSYTRTAVLEKGNCITITDHYEGAATACLSLMFYEKPVVHGSVIQIGTLGSCRIEGAAAIKIEVIPITDDRLRTAWKHDVYRCLVMMEKTDLVLTIKG